MTGNLRINPQLVIDFTVGNGQIRLNLPERQLTATADSLILRVLATVPELDKSGDHWQSLVSEYTAASIQATVSEMLESGILLPDDEAQSGIESSWSEWDLPAWFFHLATKDTKRYVGEEEQLASAQRSTAAAPQPDRFKCDCVSSQLSVELPTVESLSAASLGDALLKRRTCRNFSDQAITLQELTNMLFYSGGYLFENESDYFGRVLKRCHPGPGSRHGIELYPMVNRCEGVTPGTYHYCCKHHRLNLVNAADPGGLIPEFVWYQDYFSSPAAIIFYSYVVPRLRYKYKVPRVYRSMLMETGHSAQDALLVGTALGLGVFTTAAITDSKLEQHLGLDGIDEILLYCVGVGRRDPSYSFPTENVEFSPHLPAGAEEDLLPKASI